MSSREKYIFYTKLGLIGLFGLLIVMAVFLGIIALIDIPVSSQEISESISNEQFFGSE